MITKSENREEIGNLKQLAVLGALHEPVEMGVVRFGSLIDRSPQTAARRLERLERAGYIRRQRASGKTTVCITPLGAERLREEYEEYRLIFSPLPTNEVVLRGTVVSGLGEGQYYIALNGYRAQFVEKLGFEPYPGTLNVQLDEEGKAAKKKMKMLDGMTIYGFTDESRTFGAAKCHPAVIDGVHCAVMEPSRTHYGSEITEVIAPVCLRERLMLEDGAPVSIRVKTG
ncbi:MAG: DUF120 domain-containing protein [Methermicoccaceae archaeon]